MKTPFLMLWIEPECHIYDEHMLQGFHPQVEDPLIAYLGIR